MIDKEFAYAWGLIRKTFPEDAMSWELRRPGIGIRCADDKTPFSYASSLFVDLDNRTVSSESVEYVARAQNLVRVLNDGKTLGEFVFRR